MRSFVLVIALAACGGSGAKPTTPGGGSGSAGPGPVAEEVGADTPRTTEAGVHYLVPGGWTVIASGGIQILTAPGGDAKVAIVDARAGDVDGALAEAWQLYQSTPAPKVKLATDGKARTGWDEVKQYLYEVPAGQTASVVALRRGLAWTVVITDAPESATIRRHDQFGRIAESIQR
jgi:hypothetical protein